MVPTETSVPGNTRTSSAFAPIPLETNLPSQALSVIDEEPKQSNVIAYTSPRHTILHHRVREVAWHIPWYGFKTQARLARDAKVVPSTVSRLLRGKELPSLVVALRLTQALAQRSGRTLDVREVFSLDGTYPTASVCEIMKCSGCLPPSAFDADDNLLESFKGMEAGQWSLAPAAKGGR